MSEIRSLSKCDFDNFQRLMVLRFMHASALIAAYKIGPIEFKNQRALPIRSLAFSPVDGRQNPVSGSMSAMSNC